MLRSTQSLSFTPRILFDPLLPLLSNIAWITVRKKKEKIGETCRDWEKILSYSFATARQDGIGCIGACAKQKRKFEDLL